MVVIFTKYFAKYWDSERRFCGACGTCESNETCMQDDGQKILIEEATWETGHGSEDSIKILFKKVGVKL